MRQTIILILSIVSTLSAFSQKAIFLHHSTGSGVYYEGNVESWISDYNSANSTSFQVSERSYPTGSYPWDNYPYDFWNLWVNNACNSGESSIECLNTLTQDYNVIIFKHCFPGAGINEDSGSPDVNSSEKTLGNYKAQYRALRAKMDSYPNNKFIVWTLAPLHRNATNANDAARAREFVDWVKNIWLTEDGNPHSNIIIFDFFGIVAELNASPTNGKVNCLKYQYEGDHNGDDSHPNYAANQTAGPLFAQLIASSLESFQTPTKVESIDISSDGEVSSITSQGGELQLYASVSPSNAENKNVTWSVSSGSSHASVSENGLVTANSNGSITITATAVDGSGVSATFEITISNQFVPAESITITSENNSNTIDTDNGTLQLFATISPEDATENEVVWSIDFNPDIATISETGEVTAIKNGATYIKAALANNPYSVFKIFEIYISNQLIPADSIEIISLGNVNTIDIDKGGIQLFAQLKPFDATNTNIEWKITEGSDLATINESGFVFARKNGAIEVTATTLDGSGVSATFNITISNQFVPAESITITSENNSNTIDTDNGTLQLFATISPEYATENEIIWSIDFNPDIATISETGEVTAIKNGATYVKAALANNPYSVFKIFEILISNQLIPADSIEIISLEDVNTIDVDKGGLQLFAQLKPFDATNTNVKWEITEGSDLATINESGFVFARKNGAIEVTATTLDGSGVSDTFNITISNQFVPAESITITSEDNSNTIDTDNGTLQLYATISPEDATENEVVWSIDFNPDIATISETGKVTAIKNGKIFVKAALANNPFSVSGFFEVYITNQLIPADSIEIISLGDVKTIDIDKGGLQLFAQLKPFDATNTNIEWKITEGSDLATINESGFVFARKNGVIEVTATTLDGSGVSDTFNITISNQEILAESIEIVSVTGNFEIDIKNGELQLSATILPENAIVKIAYWEIISGKEFATITQDGLVTAKENGIVVIRATTQDGTAISDIVEITITNQSTSNKEITLQNVKVLHNKTTNSYNIIVYGEECTSKLIVYSSTGEQIISERNATNLFQVPEQKSGIYIFKITNKKGRFVGKLIF
jgi:uncharacterized protein YjdB